MPSMANQSSAAAMREPGQRVCQLDPVECLSDGASFVSMRRRTNMSNLGVSKGLYPCCPPGVVHLAAVLTIGSHQLAWYRREVL